MTLFILRIWSKRRIDKTNKQTHIVVSRDTWNHIAAN